MPNYTKLGGGDLYPAWNTEKDNPAFKEGSEIEGVLTEKRVGIGPNDSMLFVVDTGKGKMSSVWGSAVLNRLSTLPIGTQIKIKYLGLAKSKKGTSFKNYDISYDQDTLPQVDENDIVERAKKEFGV